MLEYLIKTTTNTFSTVVPFALLLAAVYRADRSERKKYLSRGVFLGVLAAFVYAVLKRNTGFAVREYYDLGALFPAIVSGVFLFPAIWLTRGGEPGKLFRAVVFCVSAAWVAYCLPNILLFPFEFAVGMDNIFNTEFAFKVAGYFLGLLLLFLTGAALFRVSVHLEDRALRAAFSLGLLVILSEEVLSVAQILLGRNMIPRYSWLTGAVIWMLTYMLGAFMFILMALSAILALSLFYRVRTTVPSGENPAQIRKKKFLARRQLQFCASVLLGVVILLLTVTVGVSFSNRTIELSPPAEMPAEGNRILIPLERVNDGNLHRFVHRVSEGDTVTDVRYIVIKKNETSFGVGLDACDVCGASGYYQRKDQVVCILCDVVMNTSTIGLPGGCNPVPLKFAVESGNIVIMTDDLAAEVRRFY
jgi:uncharacterized membrane protein